MKIVWNIAFPISSELSKRVWVEKVGTWNSSILFTFNRKSHGHIFPIIWASYCASWPWMLTEDVVFKCGMFDHIWTRCVWPQHEDVMVLHRILFCGLSPYIDFIYFFWFSEWMCIRNGNSLRRLHNKSYFSSRQWLLIQCCEDVVHITTGGHIGEWFRRLIEIRVSITLHFWL